MSGRDLLVLGTASQAPTRTRNHNGYLLRWDATGVLLDPGEGTQRQLTQADVSPVHAHRICLTHLHGDHCLGLPGVLQQLALDGRLPGPDGDGTTASLPLSFPASGRPFVERLCSASIGSRAAVRLEPVLAEPGFVVDPGPPLRITAHPLDHSVDTVGYRLDEPPGRHMLPGRLAAAGITGAAIGELRRAGRLARGGRTITLEEMSVTRPGHAAAIVMDTRVCPGAFELAAGVDLLLCEATFLESERELAEDYGHLTARQAAGIAREAGARRLVLSHFSSRYPDLRAHREEAAAVFPDVVVAEDLQVVPIPSRH